MIKIRNVWFPWRLISQEGDTFTFECETRTSLVPVWTTERVIKDRVPSLIFEYAEDIE